MSKIRLYPSGYEVECEAGGTVLSALEKAGYALPNNCRAGACGECKIKVRSGEFDQGMVLDMALSQAEREDGYGLMCMAKPLTDVLEIEWGTEDAQPKLFPPRENVSFVVVERMQRTPRIVELRLRPIGQPLRYWPGQYVIVDGADAGVHPRAYSIANAPRVDGEISLQIARVEEGTTSRWLHDEVKVGDRLKLSGPYGTFIGDPSAETPVLCLAAGTGLAPIMALAEAALSRGFHHPVTLLFPELLPEMFSDLSGHSVFVAGSPEFVESCIEVAKGLGAQDHLIHTEGFFDQQSPEVPDAERLMAG
jgi:CDP-4-dehydro-6-deoxyglucose reductase